MAREGAKRGAPLVSARIWLKGLQAVKLVPVSYEVHKAKKLASPNSWAFLRNMPLIGLYEAELASAARDIPICFTAEKDSFFPGALMGVRPDVNSFVGQDGRWCAAHIPWVIRRRPFVLARVETSENWVLCVDDESELLTEAGGIDLFNADGTPAEVITQMTDFLASLERNRTDTVAACIALDRHGLLVPWDLKVGIPGQDMKRLDGFYRVDEGTFGRLSADALLELRDSKALAMVYAHFISLTNLSKLGYFAAAHQEMEAQKASVHSGQWSLDHAFGLVEDEDRFQF